MTPIAKGGDSRWNGALKWWWQPRQERASSLRVKKEAISTWSSSLALKTLKLWLFAGDLFKVSDIYTQYIYICIYNIYIYVYTIYIYICSLIFVGVVFILCKSGRIHVLGWLGWWKSMLNDVWRWWTCDDSDIYLSTYLPI